MKTVTEKVRERHEQEKATIMKGFNDIVVSLAPIALGMYFKVVAIEPIFELKKFFANMYTWKELLVFSFIVVGVLFVVIWMVLSFISGLKTIHSVMKRRYRRRQRREQIKEEFEQEMRRTR